MKKTLLFVGLIFVSPALLATDCSGLPTKAQLKQFLQDAATGTGISDSLGPDTGVGGLFAGQRMWAAVVNRKGELCAAATSTDDPTLAWPGSQHIAKAKAYTANAFSHEDAGEGLVPAANLPLSTAQLYRLTQPGHSLYGLNNSNPFNPDCLSTPDKPNKGKGKVCAGIITFGGGVSLHTPGNTIIGGLGVSGDTACTDHEIAKRVRDLAELNPPGGPTQDDIVYAPEESLFRHPTCLNTFLNGVLINADEVPVPLP